MTTRRVIRRGESTLRPTSGTRPLHGLMSLRSPPRPSALDEGCIERTTTTKTTTALLDDVLSNQLAEPLAVALRDLVRSTADDVACSLRVLRRFLQLREQLQRERIVELPDLFELLELIVGRRLAPAVADLALAVERQSGGAGSGYVTLRFHLPTSRCMNSPKTRGPRGRLRLGPGSSPGPWRQRLVGTLSKYAASGRSSKTANGRDALGRAEGLLLPRSDRNEPRRRATAAG